MTEAQTLAACVAILSVASFSRSGVGFGDGAIAMPLMLLFLPQQIAAPVIGLLGLLLSAIILVLDWKHVDFESAKWLIAATLLGLPIGLWLLIDVPDAYAKAILGAVLVIYGIPRITASVAPALAKLPGLTLLFGMLAGIVGGAYTIPGVPVAVYAHVRGWPPDRFRATMQGFFTPTYIVIITGYVSQGLMTSQVLALFAWSLPGILIGLAVGNRFNARVPVERFRTIVQYALAALGVLMIVQSAKDWPT